MTVKSVAQYPDASLTRLSDGGGLYVHVAYCRSKCIYCDFYSAGERVADWHAYVDAVCSELAQRIDELAWPLRTIYFGGGTPSLMPEAEFIRLYSFIRPYMSAVEEFTIEVNPDDVSPHMLSVWKDCGVSRLSMGIQTFDDVCLKRIGRRHDCMTALKAFRYSRELFDNISIDLMFGLPGQSLETWRNDIDLALSLHPEHISAYCLMYEEGTPLTLLRDKGILPDAPEELTEGMFRMLIESLSAEGYDHYEISNFALPGHRSVHNSSYWLQKPYVGIGPSAHSYDGLRVRKANRPDIRSYLNRFTKENAEKIGCWSEVTDMEWLTDQELIEEYVLTRMRMREGIPIIDFRRRFGDESYSRLVEKAFELQERGMVEISKSHISLAENAILLSDAIILELASNC